MPTKANNTKKKVAKKRATKQVKRTATAAHMPGDQIVDRLEPMYKPIDYDSREYKLGVADGHSSARQEFDKQAAENPLVQLDETRKRIYGFDREIADLRQRVETLNLKRAVEKARLDGWMTMVQGLANSSRVP